MNISCELTVHYRMIFSLRRCRRRRVVRTVLALRKQSINMLDSIMSLPRQSQLLKTNLCAASTTHSWLDYYALLSTLINLTVIHRSQFFFFSISLYCHQTCSSFMDRVQRKEIRITTSSWPSFLYEDFNPNNPESGFTHGFYLVRVSCKPMTTHNF